MGDQTMRPLGAQISHMLKDRGVDVIFGIPGVHNQGMYRGIEEAGITHVLARHEQGAGFMADGYARATGKPGVAYVITGPGVCNIMTPMGQAYSDSVPMLVISSCLDETSARRGQLHQMKDQRAAAEAVCEWSEEARTAEAAYDLIDRALWEFRTKRSRPKHLQVPISVLEASAVSAQQPVEYWPNLGNNPHWAAQVTTLLKTAKRPLFILGGGAVEAEAFEEALDVIYRTRSAVFCSYAGRGHVPKDYPLNFGSYLARPTSADVISKSDLVVAVGTELAEVDLWRKHLGRNAKLVRIDLDAEVLTDHHHAEMVIEADARWFLGEVAQQLGEFEQKTDWKPEEVTAARTRWRAEVDAEYPGILPVADALRDCLTDDTMIYSDMTQFAYASKEAWDMEKAGHWHHPTGFGTLGYALPAAIGGQVGRPGQKTMAIVGDYGFHYTMAELGVAVELGLPIPIILWDNAKLGAIEDSMVSAQIAPNSVVAHNPDFVKLSEAFGACAAVPKTLAEMQRVVVDAFDAPGPTLIYITPNISA